MEKSVKKQNKLLDGLEKSIGFIIKEKTEKRVKEMENGVNKHFGRIFDKMDLVKSMLKREKPKDK